MLGYKNRPDKSSENYWIDPRDGSTWLRTGDVGRIDEDGFVELIGRTKDVIISGGFNVYPVDLEKELVQDQRVEVGAVVGVTSGKWGKTPPGFIVLQRRGSVRRCLWWESGGQ